MESALSNQLIGSAGEYFVAGELSRHGIVAALTMAGTDAFDILAVNNAGMQFAIQVKTTKDKKATWLLGKKDEHPRSAHFYYVFVRLNGEELPDCYIVPASEVAKSIAARHEAWLRTPGRGGAPHKDTAIREFQLAEHDPSYFRRWDLLQP